LRGPGGPDEEPGKKEKKACARFAHDTPV
jgi:hypothetical protein